MKEINLDPKKLLGFKIIASSESSMTLRSPKIGLKGCVPTIEAADAAKVEGGASK